jgi:glycosyltransferase involved in cell wall biosynthesis
LKIAVVTETFQPFRGGSAKRYLEVFRRIAAKGHEVHLYTARLQKQWRVEEDIGGIHVHRTPPFLPNFISDDGLRSVTPVIRFSAWVTSRLARDGPFDVLEANHCPVLPAHATWLYAKSSSRPLVVTFHEVWQRRWYNYVRHSIQAPFGMVLEKTIPPLPDVAIAVSNYTARLMEEELGIQRSKIVVIPNGVDMQMFNAEQERDRGCIIYTGRINPHKRLDLLLEAYEHLSPQIPGIRLEIVGAGPMLDAYRNLAETNGLRNISFRGAIDDTEMARQLGEAYVYVLPSIREGQSITTLEAMAAGTPQVVLIADGTAASFLVDEAGSGIAVPPDARKIADAIRTIISDEHKWKRLSENGKRYASSLSWDTSAEKSIDAYESVAASRLR